MKQGKKEERERSGKRATQRKLVRGLEQLPIDHLRLKMKKRHMRNSVGDRFRLITSATGFAKTNLSCNATASDSWHERLKRLNLSCDLRCSCHAPLLSTVLCKPSFRQLYLFEELHHTDCCRSSTCHLMSSKTGTGPSKDRCGRHPTCKSGSNRTRSPLGNDHYESEAHQSPPRAQRSKDSS